MVSGARQAQDRASLVAQASGSLRLYRSAYLVSAPQQTLPKDPEAHRLPATRALHCAAPAQASAWCRQAQAKARSRLPWRLVLSVRAVSRTTQRPTALRHRAALRAPACAATVQSRRPQQARSQRQPSMACDCDRFHHRCPARASKAGPSAPAKYLRRAPRQPRGPAAESPCECASRARRPHRVHFPARAEAPDHRTHQGTPRCPSIRRSFTNP